MKRYTEDPDTVRGALLVLGASAMNAHRSCGCAPERLGSPATAHGEVAKGGEDDDALSFTQGAGLQEAIGHGGQHSASIEGPPRPSPSRSVVFHFES